MFHLYREKFDRTQPGDTHERFELGPLRAKCCGIRIPVALVLWYYGIKR